MVHGVINFIVFAGLLLTSAFASEYGVGSRSELIRDGRSRPRRGMGQAHPEPATSSARAPSEWALAPLKDCFRRFPRMGPPVPPDSFGPSGAFGVTPGAPAIRFLVHPHRP